MARPTDGLLDDYNLRLTLDRYQEIFQLPIAAFNGLNWPEEDPQTECSTIWTQRNRDNLAMWIEAAEERRETELGYHLSPQWLVGEEHDYHRTLLLDRKLLIEVGVPTLSVISESEAITLRSGGNIVDPVEIVLDAGYAVSADEVEVMYEDELVKLRPSKVSVSGTIITIHIPRSRLVKPELMDNRQDHLYYSDDGNFITAVDIYRSYSVNDGSVNFVWSADQVSCTSSSSGCTEYTQTGCHSTLGHRAERISKIQVWPASYTDDVASAAVFRYPCKPWAARVSYLSGKTSSLNTELLTARLAHTMMPNEPCSCPYVEQYWKDDREESDYTSGYGSSKGAVDAWTADFRQRIGSGGIFA